MGILDNVDVDDSLEANIKDSLSGAFDPVVSGVYNMVVKMAFLDASKGGANYVKLECEDAQGNHFREDVYFTNRKGETSYEDRQGVKQLNPGFNRLNAMSQLLCDKTLKQAGKETETKMVDVYDFNQKKMVPMEKEVIMLWIGKPIKMGLIHLIEDKTQQNDAGKYVPTGDVREKNECDKCFRASDNKTLSEVLTETPATFLNDWKVKWEGQTKDKAKRVRDTSLPAVGATEGGGAVTPNATPSDLFSV